jgi:opacity protein-like surface antigen
MATGGMSVRRLRIVILVAVALTAAAAPARADGFVIPFYGYHFGGDSSNCDTIKCDDKHANFGVSFGSMGPVFGFEEDVSFATDFFGQVPGVENNVFSLMSNLVIGVGRGPVQPYVLVGAGLIRSHASLNVAQIDLDNNSLGYDVGAGVKAYFTRHVGIRGDVRHLHTLQSLDLPVFGSVAGQVFVTQRLDFWRASVGLALRF